MERDTFISHAAAALLKERLCQYPMPKKLSFAELAVPQLSPIFLEVVLSAKNVLLARPSSVYVNFLKLLVYSCIKQHRRFSISNPSSKNKYHLYIIHHHLIKIFNFFKNNLYLINYFNNIFFK